MQKTNTRFAKKKAEVKHFSQTNIGLRIFIFKKYSGFNGKNQEKMGKIENVVKSQQKSHANEKIIPNI